MVQLRSWNVQRAGLANSRGREVIEAIRFQRGASVDGIFALQECQYIDPDSKIIRNYFDIVMSRDKYACLLFSSSWVKGLKYKFNSDRCGGLPVSILYEACVCHFVLPSR